MIQTVINRLKRRPNEHQKEIEACFHELQDLVWNRGMFHDDHGRYGDDADREAIRKHWDQFHKICQRFNHARWKLR